MWQFPEFSRFICSILPWTAIPCISSARREGKTIWNVYRYALDTQELTQLTFPKQPDRIIDIQITHQPCGPDFSHGCCVLEDEGLKNNLLDYALTECSVSQAKQRRRSPETDESISI